MSDPALFTLTPGHTPVLVSFPHVGTHIPETLRPAYTARALQVEDTDWHLPELYDFTQALGVSTLVPSHSRYVIDLNRPPEDTPLYAGVNATGLCPTRHFTGDPLYREGQEPSAAEVVRRLQLYWHPYHAALRAELQRLHARHGWAVLFDAHSICSELPWLFDGRLPGLNLGTAGGQSCGTGLRQSLQDILAAQHNFSHVTDGRFKGGYITRHYGHPAEGWHAVQLELSWYCYMRESAPFEIDANTAAQVRPLLRALVATMTSWEPGA